MLQHTTIEAVQADNDYASKLVLPQIQVYLVYRGGNKVEYYVFRNGSILFAGNDLKPSPLHNVDGIEAIVDLIGFSTVKPGDTDPEYFANYTPAQMEWANSFECEELQGRVMDYEDKSGEYHTEAETFFTNAFTYGN